MTIKGVFNVFLVVLISFTFSACTDWSQPHSKQVAVSGKDVLITALPAKTAKPGVFLESLLDSKADLNRTLVILDLDDTVITSPEGQWLGRSEMFYDLLTKELNDSPGKNKKDIAEYIDPLLVEVYKRVPVILTDKRLPEAVKAAKKRGVLIIGMTARGHVLLDLTLEQLSQVDIQFSEVSVSDPLIIDGQKRVIVQSGLILVGQGCSKGEALEGLIQSGSLTSHFDRIIMIDDKQSHLNHVGMTVQKLWGDSVSFIPSLCTYPQMVQSYNSDEAIQQLDAFLSNWQTDPVIASMIKNDPFTRKFLKEHRE